MEDNGIPVRDMLWLDQDLGRCISELPRRLLIGAHPGHAALLACISLIAVLGVLRIEHLYVVALAAGVLTVVFDVAYGSFVPDLVDPARCFVEVGKQDALARSLTPRNRQPNATRSDDDQYISIHGNGSLLRSPLAIRSGAACSRDSGHLDADLGRSAVDVAQVLRNQFDGNGTFVAVIPMIGVAAETIGCADGVVFACAELAVDIAGKLDGGSEVPSAALNAKDCAEDDIIACAELGATGSKAAAGLIIPGENQQSTDDYKARCQAAEFAACMRIGEEAAAAGGIPFDSQSAQEATACSNLDCSACLSLGKRAADMRVPLGGVPNATDNLSGCKMGDLSAAASSVRR